MILGVDLDRLDDVAAAGDVTVIAPAPIQEQPAFEVVSIGQKASVCGREGDFLRGANEVAGCPACAVIAGTPQPEGVARHANPIGQQGIVGVVHIVDVGVVTRALVGDELGAVGRCRRLHATPARVRRGDAIHAVVGVDHRGGISQVISLGAVQGIGLGLKGGQAPVERIPARVDHAAQDGTGNVGAGFRKVARNHLATHRRVHRLRVVEDDHQVGLDRCGQHQRIRRNGEGRRPKGGASNGNSRSEDNGNACRDPAPTRQARMLVHRVLLIAWCRSTARPPLSLHVRPTPAR